MYNGEEHTTSGTIYNNYTRGKILRRFTWIRQQIKGGEIDELAMSRPCLAGGTINGQLGPFKILVLLATRSGPTKHPQLYWKPTGACADAATSESRPRPYPVDELA